MNLELYRPGAEDVSVYSKILRLHLHSLGVKFDYKEIVHDLTSEYRYKFDCLMKLYYVYTKDAGFQVLKGNLGFVDQWQKTSMRTNKYRLTYANNKSITLLYPEEENSEYYNSLFKKHFLSLDVDLLTSTDRELIKRDLELFERKDKIDHLISKCKLRAYNQNR